MVMESGENGLKHGIYYSKSFREPDGRIVIKTTMNKE
jgi:hypothetical protein